jgi:hypothetical protein
MTTIKSYACLSRLNPADPAVPIINDLLNTLIVEGERTGHGYHPDNDGYIALMERDDADRVIHELWCDRTLADVPYEGVSKRDGFWIAIYLSNNQFGIIFLIPDRDWLGEELREVLEDNLVPTTENLTL